MTVTCVCCGKVWDAGSRGYNTARSRCSNLGACCARALGPTPAKTAAKRLRKDHLHGV